MSAYGEMAFGSGLGLISGVISNYMASQREKQAREENYKYGEMAAENADTRTRALYEDYSSPAALLRQYKEAGLSPSLMFAQGANGAGGMTQGAQGTGAAGISPTSYGANLLEGAQLAVAKAQARKLNAEADTEEGKNDLGKAKIQKILQETKNEELDYVFKEYENSLKMIEVSIAASTADWKVKNYIKQTEYLEQITRSAKVQGDLDENSYNDVLKYLQERTKNLVADTILKRTQKELAEHQIKLTDTQVNDLINQIITRTAGIELEGEKLEAQINQWATENGLVKRGQNINIGSIIVNALKNEGNNSIMGLVSLLIRLAPK